MENKNIFAKVRELQKICWDIDRQSSNYRRDIANWEDIYIGRRISIWITYFLRNSSISPNQVTGLWLILGILGALLLIPGKYWMSIPAVLLLYVSWILDNVDGELARYRKQFSITGNLLDMMGHLIIFPTVFCCLTFSMILDCGNAIVIFLGLLATVFVTPFTKMQENVKLLLCIKVISLESRPDELKKRIYTTSNDENKKSTLKSVAIKIVAMIFSPIGIMYLLIPVIIFRIEGVYLAFYGLGFPLMFIPKYCARAKELSKMAEEPESLQELFRPEWLDC